MYKFAGIEVGTVVSWTKVFDVDYNDDGQLDLFSKKKFHAAADGDVPEHDYKYYLKCCDLYSCDNSTKEIVMELGIVVYPYDYEFEGIALCRDRVPYDSVPDEWYDYYYNLLDNAELVEKLNACANVLPLIDGMRGFYLDAQCNYIGTTGWDKLRSFLTDEDWLDVSLKRLKEERENASI